MLIAMHAGQYIYPFSHRKGKVAEIQKFLHVINTLQTSHAVCFSDLLHTHVTLKSETCMVEAQNLQTKIATTSRLSGVSLQAIAN